MQTVLRLGVATGGVGTELKNGTGVVVGCNGMMYFIFLKKLVYQGKKCAIFLKKNLYSVVEGVFPLPPWPEPALLLLVVVPLLVRVLQ